MRGILKLAGNTAVIVTSLIQFESATAGGEIPLSDFVFVQSSFKDVAIRGAMDLSHGEIGSAALNYGESGTIQNAVIHSKWLDGMDCIIDETANYSAGRGGYHRPAGLGLKSITRGVFSDVNIGHVGKGWLIAIDGGHPYSVIHVNGGAFPGIQEKDHYLEAFALHQFFGVHLHPNGREGGPFGQLQRASSLNDTPNTN